MIIDDSDCIDRRTFQLRETARDLEVMARASNRALVGTSDQSLTFSTRREKLESVFRGPRVSRHGEDSRRFRRDIAVSVRMLLIYAKFMGTERTEEEVVPMHDAKTVFELSSCGSSGGPGSVVFAKHEERCGWGS